MVKYVNDSAARLFCTKRFGGKCMTHFGDNTMTRIPTTAALYFMKSSVFSSIEYRNALISCIVLGGHREVNFVRVETM